MKAALIGSTSFVLLVSLLIVWFWLDAAKSTQASKPAITTYHDAQRGVTCWVLDTTAYSNAGWTNIGGISCLPDSDL